MFDRIASAHWRTMPVPHVELAGLCALARILEEAGTPSQREEIGAALDFQEASRGDVHATSVHDISVRSVLGPTQQEEAGYTAMAGVAGGGAPDTDGAHRATARRPRKRRELLAAEGGR